VVALAVVPPPGRPHAVAFVERPDFSAPLPYQLSNLPPFRYKVVARLSDAAAPGQDANTLPTGAYPDFCSLVSMPTGNVAVTDSAPTTGIDVTIYDGGGTTDPCSTPAPSNDVCPEANAGTLITDVLLNRPASMIQAPDQLIFAMLTDPAAFPTRLRVVPAKDLAAGFPQRIVFRDVPADNYLVYSCYDVGGNSLLGCGAEDFAFSYMTMQKLAVAAGKITTVELDLTNQASKLVGVEEPAARGCH
jgi:hypothetical protein